MKLLFSKNQDTSSYYKLSKELQTSNGKTYKISLLTISTSRKFISRKPYTVGKALSNPPSPEKSQIQGRTSIIIESVSQYIHIISPLLSLLPLGLSACSGPSQRRPSVTFGPARSCKRTHSRFFKPFSHRKVTHRVYPQESRATRYDLGPLFIRITVSLNKFILAFKRLDINVGKSTQKSLF